MWNARTVTLRSTLSSRERNCQFADVAGASWQKGILSGETMERFGLNTARSLLGRNVNLHLKDGSVIVNVLLSRIQKDEYERRAFVEYVPFGDRETFKVPLKSVAWAERLNLILIDG